MTDMLQMKNIIFKLQSDILQRRKQQTTDTDEMNYYEDDEYYEYDGFKTLINLSDKGTMPCTTACSQDHYQNDLLDKLDDDEETQEDAWGKTSHWGCYSTTVLVGGSEWCLAKFGDGSKKNRKTWWKEYCVLVYLVNIFKSWSTPHLFWYTMSIPHFFDTWQE